MGFVGRGGQLGSSESTCSLELQVEWVVSISE